MPSQRKQHMSSKRCVRFPARSLGWLLLVLVVLVLVLSCDASTSSTLLKHAVKTGRRSATATASTQKLAKSVLSRGGRSVAATGAKAGRFLGKTTSIGSALASHATATEQVLAFRPRTVGMRPFLRPAFTTTTKTTTSTGFKTFSQRATRLQTRLQKSFSLKAIFSDVITNHPGKQTAQAELATTTASTNPTATAETLLRVQPRPPAVRVLQDLQFMAVGTVREAWSGFVGGYALAATMGIAKRIVLPGGQAASATAAIHLPYHNLLSTSQQSLQLHSQSFKFGVEWAQMSAVFGASRLLVQTLRRQEDDWNTVAGSALAGMVFASSYTQGKLSLPPVAMTRGALLYGGTMFLLHPHLWKQGMHMAQLDQLHELNKMPTANNNNQSNNSNNTEEEDTIAAPAPVLPWWDGMQ